jgi:hypothetical protein
MCLRLGLLCDDVADRSVLTYSWIFVNWIRILHTELKTFSSPSQDAVCSKLTTQFARYPKTMFTIDCTEILIQWSSSLQSQILTFSFYKVLVGITPNGVVSFIVELWGGHVLERLVDHFPF